MNILQVVPFFSPVHGGSSVGPYNLSKELAKRGHDVTLYTSDYELSWEWVKSLSKVDVYPFKTRANFAKFYVTPGIMNHMGEEIKRFDIIHLHNYRTFQNIIVSRYAKKYGVPYVLQAHGSLPRIVEKRRLKWIYDLSFGYGLLRDASKVIALSRMEVEQYRSMGVPEEKIALIPNGIDLAEYADLPPKGAFKKKLGINEDEKIVLYLGRIHRSKGIDFLVRSFAYLIKSGTKNSKLVLAGPDDGYLNETRSLVCSLGLDERVLITGRLNEEDKIGAYVDCAICAYMNPYEPFGLVPLEAAASCRPVVVVDGTPMSEIVKQGNFGFSIRFGDVTALAKTMEMVLQDEGLAGEMGKSGREYVFTKFDWSEIVVNLAKLYEDVAKARALKQKCFGGH